MGTAIKHPVSDWVKPFKPYVICNFWHLGTLTVRRSGISGCQKLQMMA